MTEICLCVSNKTTSPCCHSPAKARPKDLLGDGTRVLERGLLPDLVNPMVTAPSPSAQSKRPGFGFEAKMSIL